MQFNKAVVLVLLSALAARAAARAVVREDVKGVKTLLQDEARDDPFFDHNPQYDFAYRIHDEETGDAKGQTEERRGDAVHGSYSVVDPDGTLRVVKYTADDEHGFNAVVSLTPGHSKPFVPPPRVAAVQRRVPVVQHHVDVPVPVQHHVLQSSSEQIVGNRRVLVEHPLHQSGATIQQHLVQPPLTLGLHQDVQHVIPQPVPQGSYQLQQLHRIPGSGIHHQMPMPLSIVHVQEPSALKQEMPMGTPFLQLTNQQNSQNLLNQQLQGQNQLIQQQDQSLLNLQQQQQGQGLMNLQQQDQSLLNLQQQQQGQGLMNLQQQDQSLLNLQQQQQGQGLMNLQQQDQSLLNLQQQQQGQGLMNLQQQDQILLNLQQQQQGQGLMNVQQQEDENTINLQLQQQVQNSLLQQQQQDQAMLNLQQQQQESSKLTPPQQQQEITQILQQGSQQDQQSTQGVQQQQESSAIFDEQEENNIQQQEGSFLPQVIEVRHSVQKVDSVLTPQQLQQQFQLQQLQQQQQQLRSLDSEIQTLPIQQQQQHRTLAVYRTSPLPGGVRRTNFVTFNSPYAHYTIS